MKKINSRTLSFIILYVLGLITLITLISIKQYYASLFIAIAIILNIFIPVSFIRYDHLNENNIKRVFILSFIRLFTMVLATMIPCFLYFFVPFIKNEVNVGFLFFAPIFSLVQYIILRVYFILNYKEESKDLK